MPDPASVPDLVTRALAAYEGLVSLGEAVEDEWSYVQDLADAWRPALEDVADDTAAGQAPPADPRTVAAVERLIDEVARIGDPHRAIDWLSTFPQAVLLALGADPWASPP